MKLVVDGVTVELGSVKILEDVSLEVGLGEVLGVFGPNGSGKTTLLKTIAGLLEPRTGVVYLDGVRIHSIPARRRAHLVSYMPPSISSTDTGMTVLDLVAMATYPSRPGPLKGPDLRVVDEALRHAGIEHLAGRRLDTLSSGELQRAILAHTLARGARVVLADEPTAYLDLAGRIEVLAALRDLARKGRIVVIATHEVLLAHSFIDKAVLLSKGRVVAAGSADEVLTPGNIERVFGVRTRVVTVDGVGRIIVPIYSGHGE